MKRTVTVTDERGRTVAEVPVEAESDDAAVKAVLQGVGLKGIELEARDWYRVRCGDSMASSEGEDFYDVARGCNLVARMREMSERLGVTADEVKRAVEATGTAVRDSTETPRRAVEEGRAAARQAKADPTRIVTTGDPTTDQMLKDRGGPLGDMVGTKEKDAFPDDVANWNLTESQASADQPLGTLGQKSLSSVGEQRYELDVTLSDGTRKQWRSLSGEEINEARRHGFGTLREPDLIDWTNTHLPPPFQDLYEAEYRRQCGQPLSAPRTAPKTADAPPKFDIPSFDLAIPGSEALIPILRDSTGKIITAEVRHPSAIEASRAYKEWYAKLGLSLSDAYCDGVADELADRD